MKYLPSAVRATSPYWVKVVTSSCTRLTSRSRSRASPRALLAPPIFKRRRSSQRFGLSARKRAEGDSNCRTSSSDRPVFHACTKRSPISLRATGVSGLTRMINFFISSTPIDVRQKICDESFNIRKYIWLLPVFDVRVITLRWFVVVADQASPRLAIKKAIPIVVTAADYGHRYAPYDHLKYCLVVEVAPKPDDGCGAHCLSVPKQMLAIMPACWHNCQHQNELIKTASYDPIKWGRGRALTTKRTAPNSISRGHQRWAAVASHSHLQPNPAFFLGAR